MFFGLDSIVSHKQLACPTRRYLSTKAQQGINSKKTHAQTVDPGTAKDCTRSGPLPPGFAWVLLVVNLLWSN